MRFKHFLIAVSILFPVFFISCDKDPEIIEKPVYVDRPVYDTVYLDSIKYEYIHDTIKLRDTITKYQTDTILLSQDSREVSEEVRLFLKNNWSYIKERMSTNFTTDGVERIYIYVSDHYAHTIGKWDNTNIVLISYSTNDIVNSFIYFDITLNDYGYKYHNYVSRLNSEFFNSPLIAVFTSVPRNNPFE